jgi:hypothetical protein
MNKISKKGKIFKNKYINLIIVVMLVAFVVMGVNKILGLEINQNTKVCEDKKGNLFVPRDKGGKIDECGKHGEAVNFNFGGQNGNNIPVSGNVAFISNSSNGGDGYLLLKNGDTWHFVADGASGIMVETWAKDDSRALPIGITVNNIIQWNNDVFLTNDGTVYKYSIYLTKWLRAGDPITNPNWVSEQ